MKFLFTILTCCIFSFVFAKTYNVGKDKVITSLRKAVERADNGDTILLNKGVYKEGNIIITRSIRIIGIDAPVLDGEEKYEILTISSDGVIIKGIHFRNSGFSGMNDLAAIGLIDSRFVIIENNTIEQSFFGIHIANSNDCIVNNNTITGDRKTEQSSGNGIHLWKCANMVIEDNTVSGHRDGIYFEFVSNSIIRNNLSHNNIRYGLHFMFSNDDAYLKNIFRDNGAGVAVMYSNHVIMIRNLFEHNWGSNAYGLLLKEISDAYVSGNRFIQNTVGILMESTNRIDASRNEFRSNGWALRIQASCDANVIHHNNFFGNTFDVATNGTMMLNEFHKNYWDKYDGYDLDKDNIGDVPHHPVGMYSMIIEQNPNAVILLRSFVVTLLDKAEKAIPGLTPVDLVDEKPLMKAIRL